MQPTVTEFGMQWINSATLQGHSGAVETIGVMRALKYIDGSPDLIATGSADGTIRIWEREVIDDAHGTVGLLTQEGKKGREY